MGVAVCLSIDQTDCLENTKVLKSKAASKVSSPEEKDDNPTGQSGKAVEEIVEGLELAELDQVLYIMPPNIDKYDT